MRRALFLTLALAACGRTGLLVGGEADDSLPFPREFPGSTPTPTGSATGTPLPALQCDPGEPELAGCWAFESSLSDGSSHGHGNNASNVDFALGVTGSAATFVSNSNFEVPASNVFNNDTITIEAWVRLPALPSGGRMTLVQRDPSFRLSVTPSGAVECLMDGDDQVNAPAGSVAANQWTHLVCYHETGGGDRHRVYVDGAQRADAGGQGGIATSSNTLRIGEAGSGDEQLVGELDVLRIWRRRLTDPEICVAAGKEPGC